MDTWERKGPEDIPVVLVILTHLHTRTAEELLNTSYAQVRAILGQLSQRPWGWPSMGCLLEAAPCYSRVQLCWKLPFSAERLRSSEGVMKGRRPRPTPSCQLPPFLPAVASLSLMVDLPLPSFFCFGSHWSCPVSSSDVWGSVGSLTGDSLFHDLFNQMNFCLYLIHVH